MIGDYIAFLSGFRFFIINFAHNIRIKLIFNSNYYNKNQKMKKFFSYFMISLCLLGTSVVTSCSSDDDDNEDKLADLPYENEAAVYQVTEESTIEYFELTSDGKYLIEHHSMVQSGLSPAFYIKDNFEYGTFKKNSDNEYQLNDKNNTILKIESIGGNDYKITYGNESYRVTKLAKTATYLTADVTPSQLCRSWKLKQVKMTAKATGAFNTEVSDSATCYSTLMSNLKTNHIDIYKSLSEKKDVENIDCISFSNTYKYIVKTDKDENGNPNYLLRRDWSWEGNQLYLKKGYEEKHGYNVSFIGSTMKLEYSDIQGSTSIKLEYLFTPLNDTLF